MKCKMILMPVILLCLSGAIQAMKQDQPNQNGKKVVYTGSQNNLLNLNLTEDEVNDMVGSTNSTQTNQNSTNNSGNVVYRSNPNRMLNLTLTSNDLAGVGLGFATNNSSSQNQVNNQIQNSGAANGGQNGLLSQQAFQNAGFILVNNNMSNGTVVPGGNGVGGTISNGQPIQPNTISLRNNYLINNIFVNIFCLILKRRNN